MSIAIQKNQEISFKGKLVQIEDLNKNKLSFVFNQKYGEIRAKIDDNQKEGIQLNKCHISEQQDFLNQFQIEVESLHDEFSQKQLWKQLQQIQKQQQEENIQIQRRSQEIPATAKQTFQNDIPQDSNNYLNQGKNVNIEKVDEISRLENKDQQQIEVYDINQNLGYSSVLKMKLKRLQFVYNQEEDKKYLIYGNFGLKGGSVVDHLHKDKVFMVYYKGKTYVLPIVKIILGIITIIYSENFNYDKYWSTVAMGGWNLIEEGTTDSLRDVIEWLKLPNQNRDYNILQRMTTDVKKDLVKNRIKYLLKFLPIQFFLIALEIYICYCVIQTYTEIPQISSKFEMLIIFFVSLLCFFETFPQTFIRIFWCKTYHSDNNVICHKFQYQYKPLFQIALCMVLIILFVILGTEEEQSAFFPTLAIYTISSDINQLKDNQGVLVTKQMKEIGSGIILGLSAEQRIHQIAILQDTISFNKYLSAFQVITSLLLILPVRYMDDGASRFELIVFISLLLIDAGVNYCDSYYYQVVYRRENTGFQKYKASLLDFMQKREKQMQSAKK